MNLAMSQAELILAAVVGIPLLVGGAIFYWKLAVPPRGQAEPDDNWPWLVMPWRWELLAFLCCVVGAYDVIHGRLTGLAWLGASAVAGYIAAVRTRQYQAGWFSTAVISALTTVYAVWSGEWVAGAVFAAHTAFLFFLAHRENS